MGYLEARTACQMINPSWTLLDLQSGEQYLQLRGILKTCHDTENAQIWINSYNSLAIPPSSFGFSGVANAPCAFVNVETGEGGESGNGEEVIILNDEASCGSIPRLVACYEPIGPIETGPGPIPTIPTFTDTVTEWMTIRATSCPIN